MVFVHALTFGQSVGYGYIIGVGFAFAVLMVGITRLLTKFFNEVQDSEMLMTAKRSIKTGLIASAVVSSWTIGSTLLLSCTSSYLNGISSAYWYGAGASVQIIFFSMLALEIKKKAPNCHTYQEVVRTRYGAPTHIVSVVYSTIQMVCYTTNLLINGSSIFSAITNMNRDAATALFPIGVIIYTLMGGIKATFLTDWTHTVIMYSFLLVFLFKCFATSDVVGSPGALWDLLVEAAERRPISGNAHGSFLTFNSVQGGLFGLVLFGAGFAAACDSQLFQKAIAADPKVLVKGYILGGLAWFSLPFCLSTTMGLAAAALETHPSFPTYPDLMSTAEVNAGLVLPYAAKALMGRTGVAMVLTMIFMAVTAAFSSEAIAISAMVTHDVYKAYIDPNAKGGRLVWVSDLTVIAFGVLTVGLGIGLAHAGFDVSFITTASGIIVNVNIVAMVLTLYWRKMSGFAYSVGTILCTLIALACWFGYTVAQSGVVNLTTLSTNEALSVGNTIAVGSPIIVMPLLVWLRPANFNWEEWLKIKQDDNTDFDAKHGLTNVLSQEDATEAVLIERNNNEAILKRQFKIGAVMATLLILFLLILFPMPLYGTKYIFSKRFFTGYIVVVFIWAFFANFVIVVIPIYDGKDALVRLFKIMTGRVEKPEGDITYVRSRELQNPSSKEKYLVKAEEASEVNSK